MKINNLHKYLIITALLVTGFQKNGYSQSNIKKVEHHIKHIPNQDLYFEIDYTDQVQINYWDKDSIKVIALVDLLDGQGNSVNKNFDLQANNSGGKHHIIAKVNNLTAHYVLKNSGSDYKPKGAFSDKVLRVGTHIQLTVPKNINIEFKASNMGDIKIDHNGGGLLASTNGNIDLNLNTSTKADLKLSSLFGDILVDDNLDIERHQPKKGLKKLSSRAEMDYKLNGGSGVQISLATYGNITIIPFKN